jgi:hypothetical protein
VIQLTEKGLKVGPTTIDNLCKQIAENVDESMVCGPDSDGQHGLLGGDRGG